MKVKHYRGFRVAKCDVEEALDGTWRAEVDDIDVVRVSAPPPERWADLRDAGFVCKPKLIRWYAPVGEDDEAYRGRMSCKQRWNLRNAERTAENAGLTAEAAGPIDEDLMTEFLALYADRIAEMRRGIDVAGGIRDDVLADDTYRAVVMRHPDGSLAGAMIGRISWADGAFRLNVSAVTPRWRHASLTRVMYARAASLARDLGLPRVSAGTDPNLFGLIAEPGLYGFKTRMGFVPTAPQRYLPDEAEHEADLVVRLDQLSDPTLVVGYRDGPDGELVLNVVGTDPQADLRRFGTGLATPPVFHDVHEAMRSCAPG